MTFGVRTFVKSIAPREEWPLKRKLAWFALYVAMFAWMGFIILPQQL